MSAEAPPAPRRSGAAPARTLVLWCPDWPVAAAGAAPGDLAAALRGNRVVAATPAARREGVAVGQRRREAQGRCPELAVLAADDGREARRFEPVAQALEALTPRLELSRPGVVAFPTRGPSRYHGGDEALARLAHARAEGELAALGWASHARVGVADGPFAATRAARTGVWPTPGDPVRVVAPGASAAFLAGHPVGALGRPELAEVLGRLGLRTLGAFAALDPGDVAGRFGAEGLAAHRLARGLEAHPPATAVPPPELAAGADVDPPADRVDVVAFVGRSLAVELHERLAALGLSCTRLAVRVETDHGEVHERLWRDEAGLAPGAVADRVRWQVDGWLHGPPAVRPTTGICRVVLTPDEVVPARGRQLGFWGGEASAAARAARAAARIEGLLGPAAVTVPEQRGGRAPAERVGQVPAGSVDLAGGWGAVAPGTAPGAPWPGRAPAPAPAVVHPRPVPAEVVDASGAAVAVGAHGLAGAAPARLSVGGGAWAEVEAWAGPWPAEERWWDPAHHRRRAWFQVVAGGRAHLLALEGGRWWVEATYA